MANGVPAVGLFSESEEEHWVVVNRPKVRVLRLKKGQKVEIEHLVEVIGEVTGGRTMSATRVLSAEELEAADGSQPPAAPAGPAATREPSPRDPNGDE